MLSKHILPFYSFALYLLAPAALRAQQPAPPDRYVAQSSSPAVAGTTSMEVLDATRRLASGDTLSYRVVEERRAPVPLIISESGELEIPLIGRVPAAGRTCKDLAQAIKPLLEHEYFYKATVIVGLYAARAKGRGHVYLTGQVHQQGAIEIPPDERFTLSRAILKAGGFSDFANKRKIRLVRKGASGATETTIVDLLPVIHRGQLDKDPELQPDDTIIVPEKFISF